MGKSKNADGVQVEWNVDVIRKPNRMRWLQIISFQKIGTIINSQTGENY